ncbi:aromatic ring-hydroxylating dioxygenase subunit alpha [Pseudomethylobacillus aquaticus]|uniref:Aromatic ring-hydroxylating dioxygenase subunit alpha n=1 Tax=Pseudomethylobacillus aquaticus TaxID=2676064 RepID=A0A3N0V5G6_9PROT|nr:aromatic ring-hydroxylating dioxygenase subunit alpha [Pseudomethylobacillus aquaticus]ROH88036.1 aromatic ring-hydroxylating dioxygenase subunit alpha [Pseudomethylobacillus aquaticus]
MVTLTSVPVSDLNKATLKRSHIPVSWYVDPSIYQLEQQHLFPHQPAYVGHTLMVPNPGDFHTLGWMQDAKALVRNQGGVALISNVCRHRQAVMLEGRGHAQHIVCPLHRWTYNLRGELMGAPHFNENPCLNLHNTELQEWQGLLFAGKRDIARDLAKLGCKQDFDFTGYMLDRVMVEEYDFNWKTFIEVYLEDYHVGPFHPGLNQFVDCEQLDWQFGDHWSVQTVGVKQALNKHGSPTYQRWQQQVLQYNQGKTPRHGAIWMVYYPFLMIEWYPNVLVVSHLIPRGPHACSNVVEFYYPEDIVLFEREFVEAQQAAYNETAVEDKEICERMHRGRQALHAQQLDESGPYQHPMETGLEHFHHWLHLQLDRHL